MKKLLFASTAVVLLSGSLANADNPLVPNDNDHMAALNTAIDRNATWTGDGGQIVTSTSQVRQYGVTAAPNGVSPGFLLHSGGSDQKRVENQYPR